MSPEEIIRRPSKFPTKAKERAEAVGGGNATKVASPDGRAYKVKNAGRRRETGGEVQRTDDQWNNAKLSKLSRECKQQTDKTSETESAYPTKEARSCAQWVTAL